MCISLLLLILAMALGVSPVADSDSHSAVDLVVWAVTSFTTIGPVNALQKDGSVAFPLIVLSIAYAMLGVASMGIAWGRFGYHAVNRSKAMEQKDQSLRQFQVLDAFCDCPKSQLKGHDNNRGQTEGRDRTQ